MADTFDAKAALDKLIKKASSWGAAEVGFAKGSFYHRESE